YSGRKVRHADERAAEPRPPGRMSPIRVAPDAKATRTARDPLPTPREPADVLARVQAVVRLVAAADEERHLAAPAPDLAAAEVGVDLVRAAAGRDEVLAVAGVDEVLARAAADAVDLARRLT